MTLSSRDIIPLNSWTFCNLNKYGKTVLPSEHKRVQLAYKVRIVVPFLSRRVEYVFYLWVQNWYDGMKFIWWHGAESAWVGARALCNRHVYFYSKARSKGRRSLSIIWHRRLMILYVCMSHSVTYFKDISLYTANITIPTGESSGFSWYTKKRKQNLNLLSSFPLHMGG